MTSACILPDATRVRRRDARDLAEMVIQTARRHGRTVAFLEPDGQVTIAPAWMWDPTRCNRWHSFVGIYTRAARIPDVMADFLAMERVH